MSELRMIIADNLTKLRKANKLTQIELAQKLNYSDKAVSKWENGDTLPDVETLKQIADLYGVKIDDLLIEAPIEEKIDLKITRRNSRNKLMITLLAVTTIWFLAIVTFAENMIVDKFNYWQAFIWALPLTFVVLLIFNSVWGKRKFAYAIITGLMWTLLLAIHLQFKDRQLWLIYLLGIPGQVAIVLASQITYQRKRKKIN